MPPSSDEQKAMLAHSLTDRLQRLDPSRGSRRLSDPSVASEIEAWMEKNNNDKSIRDSSGNGLCMLLGRFLSGSDPVLSENVNRSERLVDHYSYVTGSPQDRADKAKDDDDIGIIFINPHTSYDTENPEDYVGLSSPDHNHGAKGQWLRSRAEMASISSGFVSEGGEGGTGGVVDWGYSVDTGLEGGDTMAHHSGVFGGGADSGMSTPSTYRYARDVQSPPAQEDETDMTLVTRVEGGNLTITEGDTKHMVAKEKLNSLLALLNRSNKGSMTNHFPQQKSESFREKDLPLNSESSNKSTSGMHRCDSAPVISSPQRHWLKQPPPPAATTTAASVQDVPDVKSVAEEALATEPAELSSMASVIGSTPLIRKRASSLKSGKTPPGTPSHRKIVRFADVFGLELADVKTFLDEVPRVPKSAFMDLSLAPPEAPDLDFPIAVATASKPPVATITLVPMFAQQGSLPQFHDLVRDKKVCLSRAVAASGGGSMSISGSVWVRNLCFEKRVWVRYSSDEWTTHAEAAATYVAGSCDGFSDEFAFRVMPPVALMPGQRFQLCVRFETCGLGEYWDSNGGNNYVFQCKGSMW